MKPLYMWAGGKNKMISKYHVSPGIPLTGYDTFVEPFFGGGAMMIHIYKNAPAVKQFVINDINPEIIGLYIAIKKDFVQFINILDQYCSAYLKLSKTDRKTYFYATREEYTTRYHGWSSTKSAAVLYFLMKTAFNGIWQTNQNSNGRFATPSGLLNHKGYVYDFDNVNLWHNFLQRADIHCGDWKTCVDSVKSDRAFFFNDPPYRDSFTQYAQVFSDQQHIDLINWCCNADSSGNIIMYCNRQTSDTFYDTHRGHLCIETYPITYTAGRRKQHIDEDVISHSAKKAEEILIYSPSIINNVSTFGNGLFVEQ